MGTVSEVMAQGSNHTFWVVSELSNGLKVDQSLSHNGVCLTVEEVLPGRHRVTAIAETLAKTNLRRWQPGTVVNLERCLAMNGRLDGHIVQGHVDTVGICTGVTDRQGSWEYRFSFHPSFGPLLIEKGSVALNGTSLTVFEVAPDAFSVAIIPYTYQHTNIHTVLPGHEVNIEFDMLGKYVQRHLQLR